MDWLRTMVIVLAGLALPASAGGPKANAAPTGSEVRAELIRRAQIWMPTDIPSLDLLRGPDDPRGFAPGAVVRCDYLDESLPGNTPKFSCRVAPGDDLKVKYGGNNGEVYAEVVATRLLWALGFGADHMYSVRVICHGCPAAIGNIETRSGDRVVDPAAVERKMPGREIVLGGIEGWAWPELETVQETAGGAPRAHRDALKLLAAFIQHSDNKPNQQRLLCLDEDAKGKHEAKSERCERPFLMINDLGMTFGRANKFNKGEPGSVNLVEWSRVPVWTDAAACVAYLPRSYTGTLENPAISEEGRAFLARLLTQLSDRQLHDMFAAARVQLRPRDAARGRSGFPAIDEWVNAFKAKRAQITDRTCAS